MLKQILVKAPSLQACGVPNKALNLVPRTDAHILLIHVVFYEN